VTLPSGIDPRNIGQLSAEAEILSCKQRRRSSSTLKPTLLKPGQAPPLDNIEQGRAQNRISKFDLA
jgi:hypothetical protein